MSNDVAWLFEHDTVGTYAWHTEVFSNDECDKIIKLSSSYNKRSAETLEENSKKISEYRKSEVSFIPPGDKDFEWVYERLSGYTNKLNDDFFNFDLYGFCECLQFTEYKAPTGHYHAHIDKVSGGRLRKLSIVLQLTDPTEYEGGDFQIMNSGEYSPDNAPRERGTLLVFPSYTLHRVTPITKGTRNSIVGWIAGPPFK